MLRRVWLTLGWLWVAAVFFISLIPLPPQPFILYGVDKLQHALAYSLLMLWFCQVYVVLGTRIRLLLMLVTMGVIIEILQGMSGYRSFEYADMLANLIGVLIGWGLMRTRMGRIFTTLENHGKH